MAFHHTLKGLRIHEVSLVDAPANQHAFVTLFKRKDLSPMSEVKIKPAVKADGALDRLLVRLGITKRAPGAGEETFDPDTYADAAAETVDKATDALGTSIASILADAAVIDKAAAITKSLGEFRGFLGDAMPEQIEKAMRDVALATGAGDPPAPIVRKDGTTMPTAEEVSAAKIADLTKQLDAMKLDLAKAKMSSTHSDYMGAADMSDADKGTFMAATPAERDALMAKKPIKKAADPNVSVELTKALEETADLKKRISSFEAEREMTDFRKRASSIGLAEAQAETLLKASKGDPASFDAVLAMVKAANEQARVGKVFSEFGGAGGSTPGSAAAEVMEKADVLMKADPKLSPILARVAVRKANQALAQRERDEEKAGIRAVT